MTLSNLFAPLKPKDILKYSAYFAVLQMSFFVLTYLIAFVVQCQFPSSDPFSFAGFTGFSGFANAHSNIFHVFRMIGQYFLLGIVYALRKYYLPLKQASLKLVSVLFVLSSICIALNLLGYYNIPSEDFFQIQQRQEKHFIAMQKEYATLSTFRTMMFWTSIVTTLLGVLPCMIMPLSPYVILFYSGYILLKMFFRKLRHTV